MEMEEYKEMSKTIVRQINHGKDELDKAFEHRKINKIGTPSREIWCHDCFMVGRLYNWEEAKNLFYDQAKLDINCKLYLPGQFFKRQILICKQAYDEIEKDGFFMELLQIVNCSSSSSTQKKWIFKKNVFLSKIGLDKKTSYENNGNG